MKDYPLSIFLKKNKIKEDDFIKLMLDGILGYGDDEYIKYIKNNSKLDLQRFKYLRGHNKNHHEIYVMLWGKLASDIGNDIYYKEITTYHKDKYISSEYVGCHIWGFTRNPYLFNSLWNVWYLPRFYFYLTDNTSGGELGEKFRNELKRYIIGKFKREIIEYNKHMIKNAQKYSNILKKEKNNYLKKSLNFVAKQLVLINLSDRDKDILEVLDDNYEVIKEVQSAKDLKLEDYTY